MWKQLTPHVMVMKPMSDLCWVCQNNSMAIMRAANTPEVEKSQVIKDKKNNKTKITHTCTHPYVLKDAEAHLFLATQERSHYTSAIETSKEVLKNTFTVDGTLTVPPVNACLPAKVSDVTMHFSFDMAQQVCLPLQFTEYQTHMGIQKSTGSLSFRSTAAWANVLSHSTEMCHIWCVL